MPLPIAGQTSADGIRTERVQFQEGANSATVEGSINKCYAGVDDVLGAKAGQSVNVSMATGR